MTNSFLHSVLKTEVTPGLTTAEFETLQQELKDERQAISDAFDLLAELEFIQENASGAHPDLLLASANNALVKYDLDPIACVSMESLDAEFDYAVEGIGDMIDKLKKFVSDKLKKIGEGWKSFKKTMSYAYSDQIERAEKITAEIKDGNYKEGPFKAPSSIDRLRFYQSNGKQINPLKDFLGITKTIDEVYDYKHIDAVTDILLKAKWDSLISAQKTLHEATHLWLKLTKQKEGRLDGITLTRKDAILYHTKPGIAGFSTFTVIKRRKLADGKTMADIITGGNSITNARPIVLKADIKELPGMSKEDVIKVCETVEKFSLDAKKNLVAMQGVYDKVDDIIEAVQLGISDADIDSRDKRDLFSSIFPIVNSILFHSYGIWNFYYAATREMIAYSKMHVK